MRGTSRYVLAMNTREINAKLSTAKPGEFRDLLRLLDLFERAGHTSQEEATERPLRIVAWERYLALHNGDRPSA